MGYKPALTELNTFLIIILFNGHSIMASQFHGGLALLETWVMEGAGKLVRSFFPFIFFLSSFYMYHIFVFFSPFFFLFYFPGKKRFVCYSRARCVASMWMGKQKKNKRGGSVVGEQMLVGFLSTD